MSDVALGFGSNFGDPLANLLEAVERLSAECRFFSFSPLYRTEPVGYADQDWFLNCCALAHTTLTPPELLAGAARVEDEMKRDRGIPNGPRTIDIDILLWERLVRRKPPIVPHPRLHQRRFVLEPLAAIAPDWVHPLFGKTAARLLGELPPGERVEELSLDRWPPPTTA